MRAVLLLSGGIDSFSAGAAARASGAEIYALSCDYQQVNRKELQAAATAAAALGAHEHHVMHIDLGLGAYGRTTLLMPSTPERQGGNAGDLGSYVPARNTIFLACALGYAEVIEAQALVVGSSCIAMGTRPSRYQDCHPAFFLAFQQLAHLAVEMPTKIKVFCPLMYLNKKEVVAYGLSQGLDYGFTWSCYTGGEKHCGQCSACELRLYAFYSLGMEDPAPYERGFAHWTEAYQQRWQTLARW
jgi:7-cyano-7-deazaguanine synthase